MTKPQRIQLSRKKVFNLQEVSLALNGLPAVKVDRTTKWGNPFKITPERSQILAVGAFRSWLTIEHVTAGIADRKQWMIEHLNDLRGKNLGCWRRLSDCCHADVLLELANKD